MLIPAWAIHIDDVLAETQEQDSNSAAPTTEAPSFDFPDYLITDASELPATLKKESGNLSDEEINRSLNRADEAFAKKEWAVASSEYRRVLGKYSDKRELWLRLSLAAQRRYQVERNYQWDQLARKASIIAYQLSKNNEEKAQALLVYAQNFNPADDYEYPQYNDAIQAANTLSNIEKLKASHKDLQDIALFRYLQPRVNVESRPVNACFSFSTPIETKDINIADYVIVSPNVDGNIKVSGREICLSPLQFGGTYDVTFKAGLKNIYGEKLNKDLSVSLKVRDQESRLSFKTNAYVLKMDEKAEVPLSGVNVDSVSIKILRIPKTTLFSVVGQDKDFLTSLFGYGYQLQRFKDEIGELLYTGEMDFTKETNKTVTKQIPFSEVVKSVQPGVYIIQAEEKNALLGNQAQATQWLVISDIGMTTFTEQSGGLWVSLRSLKTAAPLSNIELNLMSYNNRVLAIEKTNKDGMVYFGPNITGGIGGNRPLMVFANGSKEDFNFLSLDTPAFDFSDRGVSGRQATFPMDAFLYTEQGVYRPGSTVHVNALLRNDKGFINDPKIPLTFKVMRSDNTVVKSSTVSGNELGLYELQIPLISSARLGQWTVLSFTDPNKDPVGRVSFAVEDFVPSRVLVQLKANPENLSSKTPTDIEVLGRYLFGSPAAGMQGDATVTLQARRTPFPKFSEYQFGLVTERFENIQIPQSMQPLDKEGKGSLQIQLEKAPQTSLPLEGVVRVSLSEQGGRPELGTLTLPIETSSDMIGIKPVFKNGTVPENEQEAQFEVIAVDSKGKIISTTGLKYEFFEEDVQYAWYRSTQYSPWQYRTLIEDKFIQDGKLSTHQKGPTLLSLPLKEWGQYRLEIKDPDTGAATSVRFQKGWLAQGENAQTPDKVVVKLEKELVKPGETIELQIESPFDGQALLTVANDRVLETRNIEVSQKGSRIKLKASEDWGVGVYCMVSAYRPLPSEHGIMNKLFSEQKSSFLPKRAIGLAWVGIDPSERTLDVQFELPNEVKPQQTIEIPLNIVTQEQGLPTSKVQLTFAAVDEGILKLTDFSTPNPVDYFLGKRTLNVEQRDLYGKLIDPLPGEIGQLRQGGDSGMLSRNMQALSKRSFKIVSIYSGVVTPDRSGKAKVKLTLPDFNGTLRLMAVAFNEKRFGSGSQPLLVRDPIVIEGVLPRFLAPKDKSTLSLYLFNVSGPEGKYTVQVDTTGSVALEDPSKNYDVILQKEGKHEFRIPFVAKTVGDGKITITLKGVGLEETTSYELSVRAASPYHRWTNNHFLKELGTFKFIHPFTEVAPETSEAMLTVSSRIPWDTQSLIRQLVKYPYGCVEQITSKGLGALFSDQKTKEQVNQAMAVLSEKQSSTGGYYLWTLPMNENGESNGGDLFLTSYVMDFYLEAKQAKFEIPNFTLERGLTWLKQTIEQKSRFSSEDLNGAAYALYILTKADRLETGALRYFADTYFDQINNPLSRAMLATALAIKGEGERADKAFKALFEMPTDGKITVGPFGSPLRNQAGILSLSLAAIKALPTLKNAQTWVETTTDYIQKSMRYAESEGNTKAKDNIEPRFSTQELAWILMASQGLNRNLNPNNEPIQVVLNDKRSYTSKEAMLQIPINPQDLKKGVELTNKGKQEVWANVSLSTLSDTPAKAEQQGVTLESKYFDLNGNEVSPSRVYSGTQMVVVIKGKQENTRPHQLLIVDLLPAGFEIENVKGFQGTEMFRWLPEQNNVAFSEARDDRYVAAVNIDENKTDFQVAYLVRAITPGVYIKPGTFAEDMYAPNFFAQNASSTIEVLATP